MNRQNGTEGNSGVRVFDFSEKGTKGLARIISGKGRGFTVATLIGVGFFLIVFLSWRDFLPVVGILLLLAQYSIAAIKISFNNKTISIVTWKKEKKYEIGKIKTITVSHHKLLRGIASITLRQRYKLNFYLIPSPNPTLNDRQDIYLELKHYVDQRFNN